MSPTRIAFHAVLVVLASACGESREPGAAKTTAQGSAGGASASPSKRQGGYVVLPSPEPAVLNPVLQNAYDLAHPLVYEGLVGVDVGGELVPRLAASWVRSSDGLTLTFHIRPGVTWQDGKPFTSADVAFTIDKIRTEHSPWAGYLEPVAKVETPDPMTLVVSLKQRYGPDLAGFIFGVIPRHLHEGKPLGEGGAQIGTGPFRVTRWETRRQMVLEANEKYWGGRPNLDQVTLVFDRHISPTKYLEALQTSKLDLAPIREIQDWPLLETPELREKFEVAVVDEAQFNLIAWNNKRKPFDDPKVRVALTHALDRQRVIEDILKGAARPMSGPFYPTMWGADPAIAPWPFDLARAAALLDAAGKTGPRRLSIELLLTEASRGASMDEMLAIFRSDLALVGVELKAVFLPRDEMVKRLIAGDFDAALYQWASDIPDPDPFVVLHSSQMGSGNYAHYSDPEVDRLVSAARGTTDRAERREAYRRVHALVHEEEPYSFLFSPQEHYVWNRRVHGVHPLDVGALPRWPGVSRWWVER